MIKNRLTLNMYTKQYVVVGGDEKNTSVSARLVLKQGVIVCHADQSWSFGHRDALRLTRRPVGPVKPLCQVVQCVCTHVMLTTVKSNLKFQQ